MFGTNSFQNSKPGYENIMLYMEDDIYRYYIGVLSTVYVFARHFVAILCAGSLQDHIRNISG